MSDPYITLEGGEDRGWTDGSWGCNSCELPDCSSGIRLPLYARRRCTHRFVSSYFIVFTCIFDNRPLCSVYLRLSVNNIGIKQKDLLDRYQPILWKCFREKLYLIKLGGRGIRKSFVCMCIDRHCSAFGKCLWSSNKYCENGFNLFNVGTIIVFDNLHTM